MGTHIDRIVSIKIVIEMFLAKRRTQECDFSWIPKEKSAATGIFERKMEICMATEEQIRKQENGSKVAKLQRYT